MLTNKNGIVIKARREYVDVVDGKPVRVLGFTPVAVGFGPTEATETWCRVTDEYVGKGRMLVHPNRLAEATA